MSKVVKLSSVMEREEKLKEIYEGLEEIKDQLTALIDEYEEEETHTGKADIGCFCHYIGNTGNIFMTGVK